MSDTVTLRVNVDANDVNLVILAAIVRLENLMDKFTKEVSRMASQDEVIAAGVAKVSADFDTISTYITTTQSHQADLQAQIDALKAAQVTSPDPAKQAVIDALVALDKKMTDAAASVAPAVTAVQTAISPTDGSAPTLPPATTPTVDTTAPATPGSDTTTTVPASAPTTPTP